jgi:glycosyltransferase 2 family protein
LTGENRRTRSHSKHYTVGLLLGALLVVCALLLYRRYGGDFHLERFLSSFRGLDYRWLAAGLLFVLFTYVGRAVRWRVMISPSRPHASLVRLLKATIIGFTAVTLFGRPGELVRPYLIAARERLPLSSQLAAWLLERIYDLLAVILIFGFALTRVKPKAGMSPALEWILNPGGYFVAAIGIVCVTLLVALSVFTEPATRRIRDALSALPERFRERADGLVTAFAGGMASTRRGGYVVQLVVYTGAEWVIILASIYCLLQAFPPTQALTITDSAVFLGFIAFGSVVQIPGIGGGMQVAAVLALTEIFGLALEPATAAALLIWLTQYATVVPLGFVLAIAEGLSWRSLRHIDEQNPTDVVERIAR